MSWFDGDGPSAFEAIVAADIFLGDDDRRRRRDGKEDPREAEEAERELQEQRYTARREAERLQHELSAGTANSATDIGPEIGDIERDGDHKNEIYGGIWTKEYGGDNKPIWFSAAPKLMDHYKAAAWATEQGGALPTMKQGDYLTTLKGKGGAFTELFNRGGSFPAGYVWLAEPYASGSYYAWCQEVRSGDQHNLNTGGIHELPVLCAVR